MLSKNDFAAKQIIVFCPMNGEKISFKNDNIIITSKENNVVYQSSCYRLLCLIVIGHTTITTGLIQRAKKFGFSIILMTAYFRYYQTISSFAEANYLLRERQYDYDSIYGGQKLITNKAKNQINNLIELRKNKTAFILKIDELINKIPQCDNLNSLLAIEGIISKVYFSAYFDNVAWNGRQPKIKRDYINSLLDIGYTMLFSYVDAISSLFGFDRYRGIMHKQFYMRKSLVCDLIEPFRVVIDKTVRKGINLKQFTEDDFDIINGKYVLKIENNKKYSQVFMNAVLDVKIDIYLYIQSFYRKMIKNELDKEFPYWNSRNDIN